MRLRIPGGQGVHVGQDEVAGAVAAEGGFVLAQDRPCRRERWPRESFA